MRFTFNSNTTSTKIPDEIIKELDRALQKIGAKHQVVGRYTIECLWNFKEQPLRQNEEVARPMDMDSLQKALAEVMGSSNNINRVEKEIKDCVRFDVEVCELPRLKNLHGLRFRRISGPSTEYKEICSKVLQTVRL
jgi:MAP/microtubule affinity-regulating kinase